MQLTRISENNSIKFKNTNVDEESMDYTTNYCK